MKSVAILGCGPAGLLCAYAMEQAGHSPTIYSKPVKSEIPGSVYLHEPIPELTGVYPENHVQYVRMGTAEGYARKVYGDGQRNTGWSEFLAVYPSWNAIRMYDVLWERYEQRVVPWQWGTGEDMEWFLNPAQWHLVISTLPATVTCHDPAHQFNGSEYWIKTLPTPPMDEKHDLVVYNGLATDLWYRWSVLGGVCSIESTFDLWPDDDSVKKGIKATTSDCDCWPGLERAGRWAEWRHGVLLTDAYKKAAELAANL